MLESYATFWEAIADAIPHADALVQGDRRVTWAEFDDRAARLASALASYGVGEGTPVALLLHNSPAFAEAVYACLKVRALPFGVNPRYTLNEVARLVDDAGAPVLVHHRSLADRTEFAFRARVLVDDRLEHAELAIAEPDGFAAASDAKPDYEEVLAASDPAPRIARPGTDHLLWYTGGTTGMPKGVLWEHQTLMAFELPYGAALLGDDPPPTPADHARAAATRAESGRSMVTLITTPLAHGTAANQLHTTLTLGGTLVMLPQGRVDGDVICRAIEHHRVRVLSVVGEVVIRRVVEALERAERAGTPYDLSSLWRIHSSGAMVRATTKRAIHAHLPGVELYDSLGATEAIGYGSLLSRHGDAPETARFRLGANARVLDADDRDVEPGSGEAGVLAVTTTTGTAYFGDDERTATTFRELDGVRTVVLGDMAVPHADGTITLLGRGSQCINTGGEKVWPEEVEEALVAHPEVADATVVGVPDDEWGEVVGAVVALRPGASRSTDELGEWVAARIARYKRPRQVVFVDEVQRTKVGKPDREWARTQLT